MPVQTILQLLAQFGPAALQLIDNLISKWSNNEPVTPAEWASLRASLSQTAADRMKAQLIAAGIPLDDPKAVALLELVK